MISFDCRLLLTWLHVFLSLKKESTNVAIFSGSCHTGRFCTQVFCHHSCHYSIVSNTCTLWPIYLPENTGNTDKRAVPEVWNNSDSSARTFRTAAVILYGLCVFWFFCYIFMLFRSYHYVVCHIHILSSLQNIAYLRCTFRTVQYGIPYECR